MEIMKHVAKYHVKDAAKVRDFKDTGEKIIQNEHIEEEEEVMKYKMCVLSEC